MPQAKKTKTREQVAILELAFDDNPSLHHARRAALAQSTGLAEKEVDYWFHNQRTAKKKKPPLPKSLATIPRKRLGYTPEQKTLLEELCLDDDSVSKANIARVASSLKITLTRAKALLSNRKQRLRTREVSPAMSTTSTFVASRDDLEDNLTVYGDDQPALVNKAYTFETVVYEPAVSVATLVDFDVKPIVTVAGTGCTVLREIDEVVNTLDAVDKLAVAVIDTAQQDEQLAATALVLLRAGVTTTALASTTTAIQSDTTSVALLTTSLMLAPSTVNYFPCWPNGRQEKQLGVDSQQHCPHTTAFTSGESG